MILASLPNRAVAIAADTPALPQHQPALDGLRGLAVAGVVAFHAGFGWAAGGFLGVSTFFTLSGFLITCLLLEEHHRTGRVDLRRFWARRFRRLLPASLMTLAAVSIGAAVLATPDQLARLRTDVFAALFDVANWRFLLAGRSYGDLFSTPSPVLHFWSLAIEEQFYVVYPVLVAVVVATTRRARRRLGVVLVALTAITVVLGVVWPAYYSTLARAPELLVGALLAVALGRRRGLEAGRAQRVAGLAGPVALGGLFVAWSSVDVEAAALFRGGFLVHALASAVVIVVAMQPGIVRTALSLPPLRWLGRISYGVYLIHWPIFVWLTPERAGVSGLMLVALQLTLTLGLAALSSHFVEQPIRTGRGRRVLRAPVFLPAFAVIAVVSVLVVTIEAPAPQSEFAAATTTPSRLASVDDSIPRIEVFGDSTALRTAYGLPGWGMRTARLSAVITQTRLGCSLARGGVVDTFGRPHASGADCDAWPQRWRSAVEAGRPDAVVLQIGPWDVSDRKRPGRANFEHVGQPAYDAFLKQEMHLAVDVLSSTGAQVLWLTSPTIDLQRMAVPRPTKPLPASDPARMARLNALIREVAAERADVVQVIDLAQYLRNAPGGELDPALRPDGVHLSEQASIELASWLGPQVLGALRPSG